jgi:hypothetical protein
MMRKIKKKNEINTLIFVIFLLNKVSNYKILIIKSIFILLCITINLINLIFFY